MWNSNRSWWTQALLVALAALGSQARAGGLECPAGFEPIPSGAACAATELAGADGTFAGLIAEVPAGRSCPDGFERPPGVSFCVATRLTVNAGGKLPILERKTSRFCPEGFHRQPGSSLCVASNLRLTLQANTATLLGSTEICPEGFHHPEGSVDEVGCIPSNVTTVSSTLEKPRGPHCPRGFHRPPGVTICIAKNLVYSSTVPLNVQVPAGTCPRNWHRPPGVRFCIPSHEHAGTGGGTTIRGYTPNLCPVGTYEVWFDVPVYDDETGWFIVDYIPTRFCVPDDLEPAG